ncbi:glycosyltransferase family 8 protein [Tetragenococcus halophilus]|uniref:Glycosyltransferase family 8 protein n=1 Tax=Tetragenococcus halophilus TaxID=51669 RepID=A0A3G5FG15_TETHA|nr:glycosyltransferase family 8 protein [Tetragenococcus halophilus]AYW49287.1 glycosyltransferase family 8 protein [Tetragenococcus halophilus]GBD62574.1 putative glycosyltransferase [Tetragenococcus halophilus subsp. flandriensis]
MKINLLFSIDDQFVEQMKTTLFSIYQNTDASHQFTVYVLQKKLLEQNEAIKSFCTKWKMNYVPLVIGEDSLFEYAPVSSRYPETIYYRLMVHKFLPYSVDKILYLDADILCINDFSDLYQLDLKEYLYAAASHKKLTNMTKMINQVRLKTYEAEGYYNSGVLLINAKKAREEVQAEDIFRFIKENQYNLLLPDQDILNGLYGNKILPIPDEIYNYDVRKNATYDAISMGEWDLDWITRNSVFLHFCGREKPWEDKYRGRYAALYKHFWYKAKNE